MLNIDRVGLLKHNANSAVFGMLIIESLSIISDSEYDSSQFGET